jgi:uncharacterized protein YjbI with pentapeptide repeats
MNIGGVVSQLDEKSLPRAIGTLLELNNYEVEYSVKIHGAEVDIVARKRGDPFSPVLYVEATVQYVDNTKYGKDATKFLLVREVDKNARCLSVSTSGFTPDVLERAKKSDIFATSYEKLFASFERFDSYVEHVVSNATIRALLDSYEEPYFRDVTGEHLATKWLQEWKVSSEAPWLVVLGEYGTGKTALTQKIQHDWISDYKEDASSPIPFRIELRSFVRQFDARSLIHHFLDSNGLGHLPIDFIFHLIRNRRVILVLDGYDEMAQFLNARERRACLSALASLAADGAKGILTSRPNYFTETEELHVFEALYATLEQKKYHLGELDKFFIAGERSVDQLLERYVLSRKERYLRDLTSDQTKALVKRKLHGDEAGQKVVISLLEKIFREEVDGKRQSLSGKPVIVSYLLELVDELRSAGDEQQAGSLGEWQIYKLIIDRLMLRDLQRSPTLNPDDRRQTLQRIALLLSRKDKSAVSEEDFAAVIGEQFRSILRRLSGEELRARRDELFQDIRSSATLTRTEVAGKSGWIFSHNSLREFLVTELSISSLLGDDALEVTFPITSPMRSFVASLPAGLAGDVLVTLQSRWTKKRSPALGAFLPLVSDLLAKQDGGFSKAVHRVAGKSGSGNLDFEGAEIKDFDFAFFADRKKFTVDAKASRLSSVSLKALDLSGSDFSAATLDSVLFTDADIRRVKFDGAWLFECDLTGANVDGAAFIGLERDSSFVVRQDSEMIVLSGPAAIGWLKFRGADTDPVEPFFELQHHEKFPIVYKICENISEQKNSQLRGLTQRGAAQADPPFARSFVAALRNANLIEIVKNELVSATSAGRKELTRFVEHHEMPPVIEAFLRAQ